jgi:hypothetical protein
MRLPISSSRRGSFEFNKRLPDFDTVFLSACGVSLFFLFLLLVCPTAYSQGGANTASADLDTLVRGAQTIVRGQVTSAKVEPHPQFSNLQTVVVTLTVNETLKGEAASTITFRQYLRDARELPVLGGYKRAGELLLFLNPISPYGLTSPVALEQGRFRILRDAKGNRYALNGRGNLGLFTQVESKASSRGLIFSKSVKEMLAKPSGQVPLDVFEEAVRAFVGAAK